MTHGLTLSASLSSMILSLSVTFLFTKQQLLTSVIVFKVRYLHMGLCSVTDMLISSTSPSMSGYGGLKMVVIQSLAGTVACDYDDGDDDNDDIDITTPVYDVNTFIIYYYNYTIFI